MLFTRRAQFCILLAQTFAFLCDAPKSFAHRVNFSFNFRPPFQKRGNLFLLIALFACSPIALRRSGLWSWRGLVEERRAALSAG